MKEEPWKPPLTPHPKWVTQYLILQKTSTKLRKAQARLYKYLHGLKNQRQALQKEHEETIQAIKELTQRKAKARMHSSQRLFPQLDIQKDQTGHYYLYQKNSPHRKCSRCSKKFTEGDKVYLSNYFHNKDILTPFPYCQNCLKKELIAMKL